MGKSELKKTEEKGKVRKWIDDHTVELVVWAGGALLIGSGVYLGYGLGKDKVVGDMCSKIVPICDYCGQQGYVATINSIKDHVPDSIKIIKNIETADPDFGQHVQEEFYKVADPDKIGDMLFKKK